jgi:hypothetical protein
MIAWSTTAKYEILLQSNDSVLALRTVPTNSSFRLLLLRKDRVFPWKPDVAVPATVLASPPTAGGSLRISKDCAVAIPSASAKAHRDPIPVFQF